MCSSDLLERRGVHPEFDGVEEMQDAQCTMHNGESGTGREGVPPAVVPPKRRQLDERGVEMEAARADELEAALAGAAIWTV